MVINKRSKRSRQRGSWTHGWGAKKKHRGTGHQGGAGMAGTGKRADQKKPSIWKDPKYFGKYGFTTLKKRMKVINFDELDRQFANYLKSGLITQEQDLYIIDLEKLNVDKLLSKGTIARKIKVINGKVSQSALAKIKEAGGQFEE